MSYTDTIAAADSQISRFSTWDGIDAESWTEAVQLRNAWHAGVDDARDEAAMSRRLAELEAADA